MGAYLWMDVNNHNNNNDLIRSGLRGGLFDVWMGIILEISYNMYEGYCIR